MSPKVEAPVVGTEIDPSDPSGSVMSIVAGVLGIVLLLITVVSGVSAYNYIAQNTPDEIREVEVL